METLPGKRRSTFRELRNTYTTSFASVSKGSMSQYLISRVEHSPHITLHTNTEIEQFEGKVSLEFVTWKNRKTGKSVRRPISSVFVMIGADLTPGWVYRAVKLNNKALFLPGVKLDLSLHPLRRVFWLVYAVGDVKADSRKACGLRGWRGFCRHIGYPSVSSARRRLESPDHAKAI